MSLAQGNVTKSDGYKATYVASWAAFVPTTFNIFTIAGSITKTIKVLRIGWSGTQTTASIIVVTLKTLASVTGGTPVAPTGIVPFDSTNPAATAAPVVYTAALTGSSGSKTIDTFNYLLPAPAAINSAQNEYVFDFTRRYGQALTLQSTGEIFTVQFPGGALTGISLVMWVEWTEE